MKETTPVVISSELSLKSIEAIGQVWVLSHAIPDCRKMLLSLVCVKDEPLGNCIIVLINL